MPRSPPRAAAPRCNRPQIRAEYAWTAISTRSSAERREPDARARGAAAPAAPPSRPKTFALVGHRRRLLLALVLGGLYGFNRLPRASDRGLLRQQQAAAGAGRRGDGDERSGAAFRHRHRLARRGASGDGHARNRRPGHQDPVRARRRGQSRRPAGAAQRRARARRSRQLPGAGALAAVSLQRAKSTGASASSDSQDTVDQNQSQLDQAQAQIAKTEAIIAQKLIKAPFDGRLGVRQVDLGQYLNPGAPMVTLTDLKHALRQFHAALAGSAPRSLSGRRSTSPPTRFPAAASPRRSRRSSRRSAPTPAR